MAGLLQQFFLQEHKTLHQSI